MCYFLLYLLLFRCKKGGYKISVNAGHTTTGSGYGAEFWTCKGNKREAAEVTLIRIFRLGMFTELCKEVKGQRPKETG